MSWLTNLNVDWSQVLAFLIDCALKGSIVIATAAAVVWLLPKTNRRRSSTSAPHLSARVR